MSENAKRFAIGERVIWHHEPRGGYGYVFRIPAVVVGYGRARIRIMVLHAKRRTVSGRHVRDESLERSMLTGSEKAVVAEIESNLSVYYRMTPEVLFGPDGPFNGPVALATAE